jgi:cation transport regulator ChaC
MIDGVEVAYLYDVDTDWSEGINEYGIGVVSSALMVIDDEAVKKEKARAEDGIRIRKILRKTTLGGAIEEAARTGMTGHTFIATKDEIATYEPEDEHPWVRILDTSLGLVAVRTNHGEDTTGTGYTKGPDYKSSISRKQQAERCLHKTKRVNDIAMAMPKQRMKDRTHPNNMMRDVVDGMMTTSLAVVDPEMLTLKTYLVPGKVDFCGIDNRLPRGRKPKIILEFYEFQGWDNQYPTLRELDNKDLRSMKIFTYGSLMLDPVKPDLVLSAEKASVKGHRRHFNRFSKGRDHLVIGTEPEGEMEGIVYEYPMEVAENVLRQIDRREGFRPDRETDINSYLRAPAYAKTKKHPEGVRAIIYVTNPDGPGHKGHLTAETVARKLTQGKGYKYLKDVAAALAKTKCSDPYIESLLDQVEQKRSDKEASHKIAEEHFLKMIGEVTDRFCE